MRKNETGGSANTVRGPMRRVLAGAAASAAGIALLASAATAASAATTQETAPVADRVAPAVSGVSWHNLSLRNHWASSQSQWDSGNPSWAVQNGIVYLRGGMHQSTGANVEFAVLPRAARPAHELYIEVYAYNGSSIELIVHPSGVMDVSNYPNLQGQAYTSLSGIAFSAAPAAGHKLSLINGWRSSQSQWNTGNPAYLVKSGVVYLLGSLHQPSGTNDVFAVLPPSARPANEVIFNVYTYNGAVGTVTVERNGSVYARFGGYQQFTSLAGISFPARPTTGHQLSLLNGWQVYPTYGYPSYWVRNGIVHLIGDLFQPSGTGDLFAVLPPSARPRHNIWITVYNYGGAVGSIWVSPNGQVHAFGSAAQTFAALDEVSYPVNS